ncbi:MAG TPA: diguanylate cyclase [Planctomycetes bacterium]|nr:diguanylate cyclase [Planctomycetota bacterium]
MPDAIPQHPLQNVPADDASARDIEKILDGSEDAISTPRLAEIVGGDVPGDARERDLLRKEQERRPENFYSDLIHAISGLQYPEDEACKMWKDILLHKMEMSQRMGRNVGIHVAALDYFKNLRGELEQVHIVASSLLLATARLAITDGLTGLYNHRYFQDRLERELRHAREVSDCVSLLMIDIDFFKVYNDLNGHIAGDVALREVAETIRSNVKEGDVAARYGGEEFAVIMCDTRKEDAAGAAERIRLAVEGVSFPSEEVLPTGNLTVSVGVAEFPQDAHDRTGLIAHADRALYVAKRSGRNRVCAVVGDRRMTRRTQHNLAVRWHVLPNDGVFHTFECRDISLEGMGVYGREIPEPGRVIRIFLPGAEDDPVLGQVVWRTEKSDNGMAAGVRFVALDKRQERNLMEAVGP